MGTEALPDLDLSPTEFDDAQQELLVAQKFDRDAAGNLRTPYPASAATSRVIAAWMNRVDDTLRAVQRRFRGAAQIGTAGNLDADAGAQLSLSSGTALLVNATGAAFVPLRTAQLLLSSGARILDGSGSPEGAAIAGRGSVYLDVSTGDMYRKTTAFGNTGWVLVGAGGGVTVAPFAYDTSSSSAARWVPFGRPLASLSSSPPGSNDAQLFWLPPVSGEVATIRMTSEGDPGDVEMQFYESDGTTTRGALAEGDVGVIADTSTLYRTTFEFDPPIAVTAGEALLLECAPTTAPGEVSGTVIVE